MTHLARNWIAALALTLLSGQASAEPIKVVASFSILADLVRNVGGEFVEVSSLVGPDTDMHAFQPSPSDAKRLLGARLLVFNGLGFESWAERLIKASGYRGPRIDASSGIKPLEAAGHKHAGHTHDRIDPHAWHDVDHVKRYVANIRDALTRIDPARKDDFARRAAEYTSRLDQLDREIRDLFADVPKDARRVISSHDAFRYFGERYGITFLPAQGLRAEGEPSAKAIASLIREIRAKNVRAVFVENTSSPRLVERIAAETGAALGGTLYSDALSKPGGPAATYIDFMGSNARALSAALKQERR